MRILHFALPFSLESSKGAGAEHDKSICRLEIIPQCAVGLNLPAALSSDTGYGRTCSLIPCPGLNQDRDNL